MKIKMMNKLNNPLIKTENFGIEQIKKSYLKINFLIQKGLVYNLEDSKMYLNSTIYFGQISNMDLAHYYVEIQGHYHYYEMLKKKYELYEYIDHKAMKIAIANHGNILNVEDFIDYKKLAKDILEKDNFIDIYYRFEGNIFAITEGKCWHSGDETLDPDIAALSYVSVKNRIDKGLDINVAIKSTYNDFLGEVA